MNFDPIITDAGRVAVADASGQGLTAVIAEIAVGDAHYDVRDVNGDPIAAAAARTALAGERLRVPVYAGGNPDPGSVIVNARVPSTGVAADQFYISEIGFFDAGGTLIFVWSDAAGNIGFRGDLAELHISLGLRWEDLPSGAVTVNVLDATLSSHMIRQAQHDAMIRGVVAAAGLAWDETDPELLDAAIATRTATQFDLVAVRKPTVTAPANGTMDVGGRPTVAGNTYYSLYGVTHGASRFQVASDIEFANLAYDSGAVTASASHEVPNGTLATSTLYHARLRYADVEGVWSDWSDPVSFTTAASFDGVVQPSPVSPANGATGVVLQPTLQSSVFTISGGADTHLSSDWQIDVAGGDFSAPIWARNSTTELTSKVASDAGLVAATAYKWRVRHQGTAYGLSAWSAAAGFTTGVPSGSVTITTPGSGTWTVPAGIYSIRETVFGGGAGGPGLGSPSSRSGGGSGGGGAQRTRAVVPGQQISYEVGAGGAVGEAGGTSSIDGEMSATGGQPTTASQIGVAGGQGYGGDVNGTGGGGGGYAGGSDATSLGGGGGAFPNGDGTDAPGGAGAGGGGAGGGYVSGTPQDGVSPGGGGCGNENSQSAAGAGAPGEVKFEWGPGI